MEPVYRDGDVVIAKRLKKAKLSEAVGRDCIVKTMTGHGYVRTLKKGSKRGVFRLRAVKAENDLDDVEIEWAAPIIWIGRAQ
jgi:phage repressor protein C with HTH and peptisase S24 domain